MKSLHLLVFALLAIVVLILVYNQQRQQQIMLTMSDALVRVGQSTEDYRKETRALISTILQVPKLQEPEEREPMGFKYPNQA